MDETPSQPEERLISDDVIPHGNLPPLRERDLPEPVPIRKMIGPGVMLAGLALGSGEFVIWPYITSQQGFVFFWACMLGVITQYFMNMEITRWSLATGESALTGFARMGRHWGWIFLLLNIIPWMVPAWARGAAHMIGWLFSGEEPDKTTITMLSIAGLFGCGIVLTAGKVVYDTVERIQLILVSLIMILTIVLAAFLVRGDAIVAQLTGTLSFGFPEITEDLNAVLFLGALAFAGVGGTLNLCQSNYVKDKGYGMGRYIGRITSPITGQEEAISEVGYHFPRTDANMARWRQWWRAASVEHFVSFFLPCMVTLVLLTLITYSIFYDASGALLPEAGQYKEGMSFIFGEAIELKNRFGPPAQLTFLVMGVAILLTTELGVLDAASRISMDIVKVNWLRNNARWTESRIYYAFVWGTILLGTLLLIVGTDTISSFGLFKFSAAMNGGVMFLYSLILLWLNRFRLPPGVRMPFWRVAIMIWAVCFFGFFAVWVGWDVLTKLLGTA